MKGEGRKGAEGRGGKGGREREEGNTKMKLVI